MTEVLTTIKHKFGGREFEIKPYPIKVMKALMGMLEAQQTNGGGALRQVEDTLAYVFAGLQAADITLTQDDFDNLHATQQDIMETFKLISQQAGMKPKAGEAPLESPNP